MATVTAGTSTGNDAPLLITFQNQVLQAINDGAFAEMLAAVTDTAGASLGLSGSANTISKTAIGDVPIFGIPFSVTSVLKGTLLHPFRLGAYL